MRRPQTPQIDIRGMLRQVPRMAWICALLACLNAVCWSIITPPFELIDEPSHFAYTQQLAENEALPVSDEYQYSPEELAVLLSLRQGEIRARPGRRTISSAGEQKSLEEAQHQHFARYGSGAVGGSAAGPPLYYLLETIPYGLASKGTLLDQLQAMRLLSALMGALTALFVFLFVRETLPATPWAWAVGGLSAALAPLLGFMSGGVNPDAMLFAVSAAIFYCLARGFRGGLTRNLAVAIGALTAAGLLTKLNFIGLVPGIVLGLIALGVRAARVEGRRAAFTPVGIGLAIAASPVLLYLLINVLSNHPSFGIVSDTLRGQWHSLLSGLSYVWQLYLPHLPGTKNYFPGLSTARDLWFNKSIGFYGWLDTSFPIWVDSIALIPAGIIAALCVRGLLLGRAALRLHLTEIIVYIAMAVGLMVLIGATAYLNRDESLGFAEPRYLMPLLPLGAVMLALAARGAGRRWGTAVGAVIVVLFLAHDIFSQLLVIGRFYG
jgi:4-amino-4-deoxy-L-arabinose transferase-like glycosyltransferase